MRGGGGGGEGELIILNVNMLRSESILFPPFSKYSLFLPIFVELGGGGGEGSHLVNFVFESRDAKSTRTAKTQTSRSICAA